MGIQARASVRLSLLSLLPLGMSLVLGLASCSSAAGGISSVSASVVFDYADRESLPRVSLSVFAQPTYEAERVSMVSIVSLATGWQWDSASPVVLSSRKGTGWAGCMNCVPAPEQDIPQGRYVLFCTDAAAEQADASFTVSYPRELLTLTEEAAERFLMSRGTVVSYTALYDTGGTLIYYGENDADRSVYPTARTKRRCLVADGGLTVCMLSRVSL